MKREILIIATFTCVLFTGCHSKAEEIPEQIASQIIVRASNSDMATTTRSTLMESVVFTGEDILWFNEVTKELRFTDNTSNKPSVVNFSEINFYIDNEYLFSSMTYVNSYSSQVFNSLVLYFDVIGNKFYLADGYPEVSVLLDSQKAQELRDENMQKIASQWNKFIEELKKEKKYKLN